MEPAPADELVRLDAALLALRRVTAAPSQSSFLQHGPERVEVSTMLVVDVLARGAATGVTCSIGDVAAGLHVAHSTASRLVDRAVRAGMVRRERSDADPRRTELALTAAGRHLHLQAVRFRTGRLRDIVADWPAEDVAAFTALLERFARDAHRPTDHNHQESP